MSPVHNTAIGLSSLSSAIIPLFLGFMSLLYLHNWCCVRRASANAIRGWRLASFLFGLSLIWVALGSPLVAYDHELLTVHMIQHLLLMTFAPALVLLGEPLLVFLNRLQRSVKGRRDFLVQKAWVRGFNRTLSRPTMCWIVSALTLIGWHVPALFDLAMHSEVWHSVEQASFLGAGLLFWWPVVQPWPSASAGPQWSTLIYLFLATLPCDILSGLLAFSDRVAYPVYFSMPRHFGFSVLEDQQCAAALMWTCVTLAYLVPAAILVTRLLSSPSAYHDESLEVELRGRAASRMGSRRLEAV